MASSSSDKAVPAGAVPAFVCSVQNDQGLNFLYLGQPTRLTLRLANTSPQNYQTQLADDDTHRACIQVDFSQVGDGVQLGAAPPAPAGFRGRAHADVARPVVEVEQAVQFWAWFRDDVLVLELPALTVSGAGGCGFITVTISYLQGQLTATAQAPLLRLAPPGPAPEPHPDALLAAFRETNTIDTNDTSPGGAVLKLRITNSSGFFRPASTDNQTPAFYVLLADGLAPGLASLTSAAAARQIDAKTADASSWLVERVGESAYPVWRLTPDPAKPGTGANIDLKLSNIQANRGGTGRGHLLVYNVNVPGASDGAQVLGARLTAGPITIASFTADQQQFDNLTQPAQVLLSWNVQNASFITLTGLGLVDAVVQNKAVAVEQTTTFVLTAYSASLAQMAARALTVTVRPDLVTRLIPKGTIVLWSGEAAGVPAGWALCDGTQGAPDLREKFVMGAGVGSGYTAPGQSGPADAHTHPIAQQQASFTTSFKEDHTHGMPTNWYARGLSCGVHTGIDTSGTFSTGTQTQPGGGHAHSVTVTFAAFTSGPNDQAYRPAWYALCYIIKQGA